MNITHHGGDLYELKFDRKTSYLGRNGVGSCIGLSISVNQKAKLLEVMPINSKGNVARCSIDIPMEVITVLFPKNIWPLLIGISPVTDSILGKEMALNSKE